MTKATLSKTLTRKLTHNLKIVAEQLKLARLRRNISMEQMSQRCSCSIMTIYKIEKGDPKVSMGAYIRFLNALNLEDDILFLAKDDPLGRIITDTKLIRKRASKNG